MQACKEVNQTFDLLGLVEQEVRLRKAGNWYIGPCPFCGGQDRFNLKKGEKGWVWYCRRCGDGKYHTVIDYALRREGSGKVGQALEFLIGGKYGARAKNVQRAPVPAKEGAEGLLDMNRWNRRANQFIDECMYELWWGADQRGLDYLRLKRGLKERVVFDYFIGFNRHERFEDGEGWGFSDHRRVWLPRGIVLPCFYRDMRVAYLKIRRAAGKPKYVKAAGSKSGVFGFRDLPGSEMIAITEGEVDCMTLHQEAGDVLGVCTLGSANEGFKNLDLAAWGLPFITAGRILTLFDNDEPGRLGARKFFDIDKLVNGRPLEGYKDINEMLVGKEDVFRWIVKLMGVEG